MWLDKVSIPRKLTLAFAITLASFATSSGIIYNTMLLDEQIGLQSRMTNDQELESTNAAAALMDMSQSARGYGMPKVAFTIGAVQKQSSLQNIAGDLFAALKETR